MNGNIISSSFTIDKAVHCGVSCINGTTADSFEYFYKLWELDKSVKLIFTNRLPDYNFYTSKYNIDTNCFKNFIELDYKDLHKYKFNKLLTFAHHLNKILHQLKEPLKIDNLYHIKNEFNNIHKITGEYHGFGEFKEVTGLNNYIYKLNFDIHKTFNNNKDYILYKCNSETLESIKIKSNLKNLIKYSNNEFINLFELIYKLVYVKTNGCFDRHPRIFDECKFHNIDIEFHNLGTILDGSVLRYNFLLHNGIQPRYLTEQDEIIQLMLN